MYRLIEKLVKILPKTCNFPAARGKIFAHEEVEIIVVHAKIAVHVEIVVQGLMGLKQ